MKTDIKKDGDCRINLSISAPAEETSETYGKILGKYLRNSQLRGFRKGKAPKDVVLRVYGPQIDAETKQIICSDLTKKAIDAEKLDLAAIVGVRDITFAPEKGIEFTAVIDVNPVFKAPKYKGLPLKYEKPAANDGEVSAQLEMLRSSFDTTAESQDPAKEGDYANISFESDLAAQGGSGESPDDPSARYLKNDNFWLQVGEKPAYEAIPGSAKALVGKKAGDDFSIGVEFPADFAIEALRGKKGTYTGKILKVNAIVHASDEAVCKGMGVATIDELKDRIRTSIEQRRDSEERMRLHGEIDSLFLKKASFGVPQSMVQVAAQAVAESVVAAEYQANAQGKTDAETYVKDHADELRSKIDERAEGIIRLNYIGKALAKELDITATENDVRALANQEAAAYSRRDPSLTGEKLFSNIVKRGELPYYQDRLRYSKVVDWIIDNDIKANAK